MRRHMELLGIAVASLLTLTASWFDAPVLVWAVLLGAPLAAAALARRRRRLEDGTGRVLMGAVVVVAAGQVLTMLVTLTPFVHVYDALPYFFLSFGVPVVVVLCLVTALLDHDVLDHGIPHEPEGAADLGSDDAGHPCPTEDR